MYKRVGILGGGSNPVDGDDDSCLFIPLGEGEAVPDLVDAVAHDNTAFSIAAARELARRHIDVLVLLADSIDCREQFKPGSSMRVLAHATRFADALGLGDEDRLVLERGALLRDIGKLRIDNNVLLKTSLMTYDEWKLLQNHTAIGAQLVKNIAGLESLAPVIRHHHECFDGTGYPDELEGKHIPLAARIVKLIDVFCAMTSPRLYRSTVATREDGLAHLQQERGKHFDPELVDLFIDKDIADEPSLAVSEIA